MSPSQRTDVTTIQETSGLRRDLGLGDLVLTQILFIVGLPWVGVAAKQGPAHVLFWLFAIVFFYLPSAVVVIHLNRAMPLEGGLYQWAKLGFGELTGFLVAWNLWLFTILNTSETGLQVTQYFGYILGRGDELTGNKWVITAVSTGILFALVVITIRGLAFGRWVHKAGGALMLATFALLLALPWLHLANGSLDAFHPLATATPVISLMSLNLLGKMGFGALGGFEYVAIHAGECRNPVRTIGRSVAVAAPVIAAMFILGTSSVLALVPIDRIDLIAPIPQVLSEGFGRLGFGSGIATITIVMLLVIRVAQASVMFAGNTRLPMVAGWDGLVPAWFTRLHPVYRTPVNSVVFVGAITLGFSIIGLVGVGKQEAFQLLWNGSAIFYALTYLVMFALPIWGFAGPSTRVMGSSLPSTRLNASLAQGRQGRAGRTGLFRAPWWLRACALSGFLMTLLFVGLSIVPIVRVESRLGFALKLSAVIVGANLGGYALFVAATRRSRL